MFPLPYYSEQILYIRAMAAWSVRTIVLICGKPIGSLGSHHFSGWVDEIQYSNEQLVKSSLISTRITNYRDWAKYVAEAETSIL